ncbi:MAG: hypothetical protein NUV74_13305 [Candidatus Brocadiaceae bacterium]|nr:hypothetical protein [Candidatus Brocadiaceae bacterium]
MSLTISDMREEIGRTFEGIENGTIEGLTKLGIARLKKTLITLRANASEENRLELKWALQLVEKIDRQSCINESRKIFGKK